MELFLLERNPLSLVSLLWLVLLGLVAATLVLLLNTNWQYLTGDRQNREIVSIDTVYVGVAKQSLDEETQNIRYSPVKLYNRSLGENGPTFLEQLELSDPETVQRFFESQTSISVTFDIPNSAHKLDNPSLVFYAVMGVWDLYFDGVKVVSDASPRSTHHFMRIGDVRKAEFVIRKYDGQRGNLGLRDLYGLTIRSQNETRIAKYWLPNQRNFLYWIATICLFFMSASSLLLFYFNTPKQYKDIPAFAAMTGFLAIMTCMKTPIFYDSFMGRGALLGTIRQCVFCGVIVSMMYLTFKFFRLDEEKRIDVRVLAWGFTAICVAITLTFLRLWTPTTNTSGVWLSCAGAIMCTVIFILGLRKLHDVKQKNIESGYPELNLPFARRYAEIALYGVSIVCLAYFYMSGFYLKSLAVGRDYWVLWGLVPSAVMFFQLQLMVGRSTSESQRLRGQLSLLERLQATNEPSVHGKNYEVVIATFDVKGFTSMQILEILNDDIRGPLMDFVHSIGDRFEALIGSENQFHKKDLGDEWIFLLRGRTGSQTAQIYKEVYEIFDKNIDQLLSQWRHDLRALLEKHDVPTVVGDELVENLTIHTSIVIADDLRITSGSGLSEKGDFKSPRYSLIKGIEKYSDHEQIAVYYNQMAANFQDISGRFEEKSGKAAAFIERLKDLNKTTALDFDAVSLDLKMGLVKRTPKTKQFDNVG